ncbi:MAG: hypothetical protein WCK43_03980 [bacterium]
MSLGLVLGNQYWTNTVTQKVTKLPVMVRSYQPSAKDILGYFIHSDLEAMTFVKVQQLKTKKLLIDYVANLVAEIKKMRCAILLQKLNQKKSIK